MRSYEVYLSRCDSQTMKKRYSSLAVKVTVAVAPIREWRLRHRRHRVIDEVAFLLAVQN